MLDNYEYNDENIRLLVDSHYQNYINLFFNHINYYNKIEIYRKRFPDVDGYEKSYFHLITKEYKPSDCDCMSPFVICNHPFSYNPLIDEKMPRELCPIRITATNCLPNYFNRDLKIWTKVLSKQGLKKRILCFDDKNDYMIMLEERKNGDIYFVTGYPIEYSSRKRRLIKEYENFKKQNHTQIKTESIPR